MYQFLVLNMSKFDIFRQYSVIVLQYNYRLS